VVSTAEHLIRDNIITNIAYNDLLPLRDHYAIHNPRLMRCAIATPAERFYLQHIHSIG
jgi:hypothetical protein